MSSPVYRAYGKPQFPVVGNIVTAVKMLLYARHINVCEPDFFESAHIEGFSAVASASVCFSGIDISENTERAIELRNIRKIFLFEYTGNTIGKSIRKSANLLPQNEIHIGFSVEVRESKVFFPVSLDKRFYCLAYVRDLLSVDRVSFFRGLFVKQDKVYCVSAVVKTTKHPVFAV